MLDNILCARCGIHAHRTFIGKAIRKQDGDGIEGISYLCLNCLNSSDPYFVPCNQIGGELPYITLCRLAKQHTGGHVFV